jgi:hypothetical protein
MEIHRIQCLLVYIIVELQGLPRDEMESARQSRFPPAWQTSSLPQKRQIDFSKKMAVCEELFWLRRSR